MRLIYVKRNKNIKNTLDNRSTTGRKTTVISSMTTTFKTATASASPNQVRFHADNTIPNSGWIWVFGSNLAGRHGKGAAKIARTNFRAEYGCGQGPTGYAYAIPTKDARLAILPLSHIRKSVQDFIAYAKASPKKRFFVTRVGCGLAGYRDDEIAPFFQNVPTNCSMPAEWEQYIGPGTREAVSPQTEAITADASVEEITPAP